MKTSHAISHAARQFSYYAWILLVISLSFNQAAFGQATLSDSKNALDQTLAALVSFETLSSQKDLNRQALKWVQEQLVGLPLFFKEYESNGYSSLVITTRDTKTPKLWLIAHMDVVPAAPSMFSLQLSGDRFIGRGVLDMKAAIAYYITLFKELGPSLKHYNLGIMLTTDEEMGGMNGVQYLLDSQNYGGKLGFLPDGGFDWHIEQNAKGVMWIKIQTHGVTSHGSRPWLGVNAINNLNQLLARLNAYFEQIKSNSASKDYYTSINLGVIRGGQSPNQVPDHAEAIIDIRYTPTFDMNGFKIFLNNLMHTTTGASYEILITGKPNHLDLNQPEVKKFTAIAETRHGIHIGTTQAHGATDARFFSEKKIPVLIISPTGGAIHSQHEWLSREHYYTFYDVFKTWVSAVGKD